MGVVHCVVASALCSLFGLGGSVAVHADGDVNVIEPSALDVSMARMVRGSLIEGQRDHKYTWLEADTTYVIQATGDVNTVDVDLRLFSPEGGLVSEDALVGGSSRLAVRLARSGQYRIQVIMAQCDHEPCDYVLVARSR